MTSHAHLLRQLECEAHVWFANPAAVVDPDQLATCASILSPEEKDRHSRFKFEKDRHLFLVAHAMVRTVLSFYVDVHPSAWQFTYTLYGRPEIAMSGINAPLRFNLTHTDGLVACLVTLNSNCGIDAEKLRLPGKPQGIAEKMFAPSEQHALSQLQGEAYLKRFFTYWTLREAYGKAIGLGLSSPMNHFDFESVDGDVFNIRFDAPPVLPPQHWQFTVLKPSPAHIMTIALCPDEPARKIAVQQFHFSLPHQARQVSGNDPRSAAI
ncbi:MAG: 4'-phosphopantetheinyl transferase superfamily protein [Thiobacillaceae bacterium]